jgi:tellurite resistance-related uncharacterized protein
MIFRAPTISALLFLSAGCAAEAPASTKQADPSAHFTEHTCKFGKYGDVTIHEGGLKNTYIIVNGKKHPSTGGHDFIQSNNDDTVVVMFDLKGNPSYQGDIPGRDCRVTRR